MPKFHVSAAVTGSKYIGEFEAATKEEAIEMATNSSAAYVSMCHQCSDECQDPECTEFYAEVIAP